MILENEMVFECPYMKPARHVVRGQLNQQLNGLNAPEMCKSKRHKVTC